MSGFAWNGVPIAWLAVGVAFLVALLGRWMARRQSVAVAAACSGGALAGWGMLAATGWRGLVWPRGLLEHALMPALVLTGAGLFAGRVRTRWLGAACAVFAAWWLAGTGVARPEFWRVMAAALVAASVLRWGRADEASRGLAVALTGLGGMVVGAGEVWIAAVGVLAASVLAMDGGDRRAVPPTLLMVGLVAGDLGAGRLIHGGMGVTDLSLLGALAAPFAVPWAERAIGRGRRRWVPHLAPWVTAVGVVGVAWVVSRVLRSYQA